MKPILNYLNETRKESVRGKNNNAFFRCIIIFWPPFWSSQGFIHRKNVTLVFLWQWTNTVMEETWTRYLISVQHQQVELQTHTDGVFFKLHWRVLLASQYLKCSGVKNESTPWDIPPGSPGLSLSYNHHLSFVFWMDSPSLRAWKLPWKLLSPMLRRRRNPTG